MTPETGTPAAEQSHDGSMLGATDALIGLLERDETLGAAEDEQPEAPETQEPKPVPVAEPTPEKTPPEEEKPSEGEGEAEAPEGTEEPAAETNQEPLHTVKVDGKEEKVTLEELKRGFSGQRWITQKSQALESERKAIQQERETLTQIIPKLLEQLGEEKEIDWEKLRQEDEFKFVVERQAWQVRQERRNALMAAQQATQAKLKEDEAKKIAETVAAEKEKLLTAIPALRDEAKAKAMTAEIRAYGKSIGFTDEELDNSYDSRAVLALYHGMIGKKAASAPMPRPVANRGPRSAAPGAGSSTPGRSADYSRMKARVKETGSVDDAAALFEQADL